MPGWSLIPHQRGWAEKSQGLQRYGDGHAGMVAHPAPTGLGHAGKEIPAHKECWKQFCRDMETQCTDQFLKGLKNKLAQQNWCLTT